MSEDQTKYCPFCGGTEFEGKPGLLNPRVICLKCGASAPGYLWNTRVDPDNFEGRCEEAEALAGDLKSYIGDWKKSLELEKKRSAELDEKNDSLIHCMAQVIDQKRKFIKIIQDFISVSDMVVNEAEDFSGDGICSLDASLLLSLRSHRNGAIIALKEYYEKAGPKTGE